MGSLRPLLDAQRAHAAWIFGSHARGTASAESDIDVIVVASTDRPFVDRFRDYLPAIANADGGVDLLVYTPEEFARMQAEERPFLVDALADARQIHGRRPSGMLGPGTEGVCPPPTDTPRPGSRTAPRSALQPP
ncbi:MAG: nucleotidyltransferase domain-containing protein [Acidobacteria bacterium]|nr:nucleotidyltransferase domain-containing protein [Acidobacteriota bacterium]